jgi:hypothetical protein
MNKTKWLKRVNVLLFVFLLLQPVTAILGEAVSGEFLEVVHPVSGVILVILGLTHLTLNWGWVRSAIFAKKR